MRFTLDVIRARKGDCLMVHYGTKAQPRLMMIDGGPSNVYKPLLRPRITQIRAARGLDDSTSLPVDVLMVSHLDDDHIQGVLDLTKELRTQKADNQPRLIRVRTLWNNCFDDLLDTTPDELKAHASFGAAAVNGEIELDENADIDVAKVLASIPQGRMLRDDAAFLHDLNSWNVNEQFNGKLILRNADSAPFTLDGGLGITVLGPMHDELAALQKEHDKWLKANKDKIGVETALAAFVDKSVTNLSSIVVLAEAAGKRMLLTGDARGDKVLSGLEMAGLLTASPSGTMHVDVLKVPHHGSSNNLAPIFFARVTADHYVFSGNGEHGNPERATIEMLFKARGNAPLTLYFTYPIDEIDVERKKDWEKEQAKEVAKGKTPRPDWSAAKNSLRSFFNKHPLASGQRIVEIPDTSGGHHLIELLDTI